MAKCLISSILRATLLAGLLSGCGYQPPTQGQLVQVAPITASLKCAFATALLAEREPGRIERLKGRIASGTLTLKIVDDRKISAGAKPQGPFVLSAKPSLVSITPSFGLSSQETDTVTTVIAFRYRLAADNDRACSLPEAQGDRYHFSTWLASIIAGLDIPAGVQPTGVVESINYTGDFAVINTGNAGVDFDVIFFSTNLGLSQTRNDVQTIAFKIAPVSKTNPPPRGGGVGGVGPAAPPPNLGPAAPPPPPS
jgi:hypothetical protein